MIHGTSALPGFAPPEILSLKVVTFKEAGHSRQGRTPRTNHRPEGTGLLNSKFAKDCSVSAGVSRIRLLISL